MAAHSKLQAYYSSKQSRKLNKRNRKKIKQDKKDADRLAAYRLRHPKVTFAECANISAHDRNVLKVVMLDGMTIPQAEAKLAKIWEDA